MRHLQLYIALREVVSEGSIRQAAEKLSISPSALNRKILALEEELGVPFFERLPGGVRLSTAGEIYYRHFIEHLAEIERARATVADLAGVRTGHVRIAASLGFEQGMLPNLCRSFRSEHPGVRFSLVPTPDEGIAARLLGLDQDLSFQIARPPADGVEVIGLAHMPIMVLLAQEHTAGRVQLGLGDLDKFDLILPPEPHGFRRHLDSRLRQLRGQLNGAVESAAVLPVVSAPTPTAQICLSAMVDPSMMQAQGAVLLPLDRVPPIEVMICKRAGRSLPVAAGKFAMQMAAELAGV